MWNRNKPFQLTWERTTTYEIGGEGAGNCPADYNQIARPTELGAKWLLFKALSFGVLCYAAFIHAISSG